MYATKGVYMSIDKRLPTPGGDSGNWGEILNDYLDVSLDAVGNIKPSALTDAGGILSSQIGQPSGVAGLNSSGLVPATKLATGTASATNFLRGDGTWATPTNTPGPQGEQGEDGIQGPAGSEGTIAAYASYYTSGTTDPIGGQNVLSFNTSSINVGSAISVSGAIITISANGTYLLSVSGIVQEMLFETSGPTSLAFSAGFRSKKDQGSWVDVPPFPLVTNLSYSPTDFSGNITAAAASLSISQMVTVTNAPLTFTTVLDNSSSSYYVTVTNPSLNIIKLD